jgi:hypothetical protein
MRLNAFFSFFNPTKMLCNSTNGSFARRRPNVPSPRNHQRGPGKGLGT